MARGVFAALALALLAACAPPPPGVSQLALSVSNRLVFYGISVAPQSLSRDQAAALHTLLVQRKGFNETRRRAESILSERRRAG